MKSLVETCQPTAEAIHWKKNHKQCSVWGVDGLYYMQQVQGGKEKKKEKKKNL